MFLVFATAPAVHAQPPVLVAGGPEDFFKSAGMDADGTVVIAGDRRGAAGYFELKAGSLTFTPIGVESIPPIVGSFALYPEKYVSRDGRFVIARGMDEEVRVWDRKAGKAVAGIEGRIWPFPLAVSVASVNGEPLVAGEALAIDGLWPTLWSPSVGYRFDTSSPPTWLAYDALTADGRALGAGYWMGEHKGYVGNSTRFDSVLEPYGNDNLGLYAVSPNGRVVSGWLAGPPFRTAMLWTDGVPRPLTLPTEEPATLTGAVTDSGFAGGTKPDALPIGRGYIFDPREGRVRWFDEWWNEHSPTKSLESNVTAVGDLMDADDRLVCVLQGDRPQVAIITRTAAAGVASHPVLESAEPTTDTTPELEAPTSEPPARAVRPAGPDPSTFSIARVWDEEALSAIRIDLPNPPVHARNLFHLSIAMYDAWAAFDPVAPGVIYQAKHPATDIAKARHAAISYAAYRTLRERYALSRNSLQSLFLLDSRMSALGYDRNDTSLQPDSPVGVGNRVAAAVAAFSVDDGARQLQNYREPSRYNGGYTALNPPMVTLAGGIVNWDVNQWQPLSISGATTQNGIPLDSVQVYAGSQWHHVRPFALSRTDPAAIWIDPGPPPHLGTASDAQFREQVLSVIRYSSEMTTEDNVDMDISPGAFGNNTLGTNDGKGHPFNPVTGAPYAPNRIRRGDFARVLAEFWADGPTSETPPGHWNSIANYVTDNPANSRRIGGSGPELEPLEWDVKMYLALNGALHDAACAAWTIKRHYNGWRPISAIRFMGQRGQSTDPTAPKYHPDGLPLIPGLIEVQLAPQPGGQGATVPTVMIRAWRGQPSNPLTQVGGVGWIPAVNWLPYQRRTFITPAFPGYVSGHSTFSRAGAEVLTALTGSPFFPGGLGTFTAARTNFLFFELGPTTDVQLQWATYYDAADQAGISRLWGGIHVPIDDFTGRKVGSEVGRRAWALARKYIDGTIRNSPVELTVQPAGPGQCELRFNSVRGQRYQVQSTPDLSIPFTDVAANPVVATDSPTVRVEPDSTSARFFRVVQLPAP